MCDEGVCPIAVTLAAAESVIDSLVDLHESPQFARGNIAVIRKCNESVRSRYLCTGPAVNDHNQIVCPLGTLFADTQTLATQPVHRGAWAFDPEKLVDGGDGDAPMGQML